MADIAASLSQRLATSATGYAAVIDGVLNIRTVNETRNMAAHNALWVSGCRIFTTCKDLDCDCMVKLLEEMFPAVKIIAVQVETTNA